MRKTIAALLAAATLASPALAQRDPGGGGMQAAPERAAPSQQTVRAGARYALGGDRQDRREARQERRQDRAEFRQERRGDRQEFRRERFQDRQAVRNSEVTRQEFRRDRAQDARDFRRDRVEDRRDFRRDRAEDRRDWQRDRNGDRNWQRDRNWSGHNDRWQDHRAWDRNWRRDPRYNWQDWRHRNRGSWNFPRYYAPRGWDYGYRRFSFGAYLSAPLFAQNYWIDDPFQYQLPPAYGPYRWVRYYDDVLLIDVRNGLVVDVIYDFFW